MARPSSAPDPATIRRRRRNALAALAAVAALGGAIVGAGSEEAPGPPPPPGYCERPGADALARAAGQTVMVRMEGRATAELLQQARSGAIGGVVLFPPEGAAPGRLRRELARLRAAAAVGGNPPPLAAIDQEGGIVRRLPELPPEISPYTIAQEDDLRSARLEGAATGFQLGELGIDVNLAPVLDIPESPDQFMAPRAFGRDPGQVSRLGLAFAAALQREGVAATAKHFPGLGRALENTDFAPTAVVAGRRELRSDLRPFSDAIEAGVRIVMVGSASYPVLGDSRPASLSPAVTGELLRGELGFEGVVITDDLLAPAIAVRYTRSQAAVLAARAGADVLLFAAREAPGVARSLVLAARDGALDPDGLRASCARIVALKHELGAAGPLE